MNIELVPVGGEEPYYIPLSSIHRLGEVVWPDNVTRFTATTAAGDVEVDEDYVSTFIDPPRSPSTGSDVKVLFVPESRQTEEAVEDALSPYLIDGWTVAACVYMPALPDVGAIGSLVYTLTKPRPGLTFQEQMEARGFVFGN